MQRDVEVPGEALEAAGRRHYEDVRGETWISWDEQSPRYRGEWINCIRPCLEEAAPFIRSQERELCQSCDDTGIYEEGDEWMPCDECDLGRGFAERLKTFAAERAQRGRQRVRERLKDLRKRWLDDDESPAQYKQGKLDAITHFLAALDSLEDGDG